MKNGKRKMTNGKCSFAKAKTQVRALLPGLVLSFPVRKQIDEEKRDAAQKEHVDPSLFVKKEIKNGPRDQKTTADFPNHFVGSRETR